MRKAVIIRMETTGECELCEIGDEKLFALVIDDEEIHLLCEDCAETLSKWFNIPIKGEQ